MQTVYINGQNVPANCPPAAIALGFFDGVHTGHMALFHRVKAEAAARGVPAALFMFAEGEHMKPNSPRLTSEKERLFHIEAAGIDIVYLFEFDALRDLPSSVFVENILLHGLHAVCVACGFNFRFGAGGAGDTGTLAACLAPHGVPLAILPPYTVDGQTVSSTAARAAIEAGDAARAAALLGRPYSVTGEVVHGRALGRQLGFPTANLALPRGRVVPAGGVYAVVAEIGGKQFPAVANVGRRPTVEQNGTVNCEVHVFGIESDLYGQTVTVYFHRFLRGEMKFESIEALSLGIAADKKKAEEYFHGRMDKTQRPL